ncbi:MAG: sodium:proton antiporter [Actinomycetota bacterium]|nr:sodium:proton antiporter [Actinomycetota bacterium]
MSRPVRYVVFCLGVVGLAILLAPAVAHLPAFGSTFHPYRTLAVAAAVAHRTANVVSAINFDQRGLDTFGEESIFLASVAGAALLLRPGEHETERRPLGHARMLDATRLLGYVLLPLSTILGLDLISHGNVTPGGGFQGGVVLGTGLHLLYVAGSYDALEKMRPTTLFEWGEAIGAGSYGALGVAGLLASGAFLANFVPLGHFGALFSGGTVPLLNIAVGIEVASGGAILLSHFLRQAMFTEPAGGGRRASGERDE